MNSPEKANPILRRRRLTRGRIILALAIAIVADGVQFFSGFLGWVGFDQAVDCGAMIFTTWLLGFHVLLLPTFVVELLPVVDMLPTWTACVVTVIALRKRNGQTACAPTSKSD
ncbi:MAG TPA: hypothetical protein VGO57_19250 [Verrucomicrobiae bacterium]